MVGEPISILGMGICSCLGITVQQTMERMLKGGISAQPVKRFEFNHPRSTPVFEIQDFSWLPAYHQEELLLTTRFWLYACEQALADAGLSPEFLKKKRVGVCVGTTVGMAMNNEAFNRSYFKGEVPDMAPIYRYLRSNPATMAMHYFGWEGPSTCVGNACASGTDALGIALTWLRIGLCDYVIAGGTDELCRVTYGGFLSLMNTSTKECKPFDRNRDGLNLGEGAAAFVLSKKAAASSSKGFLLGYGTFAESYHPTAPHPEGIGLKKALIQAMEDARVNPQDIALINTHGTGTMENDKVEGLVLKEFFPHVPFVSTKGYVGHTLGAAGAMEALFTLWSLNEGITPPTRGFTEIDPEIGISPVTTIQHLHGKIGLSQSLAFGGVNSVIILSAGDQ